jgi:hypothetical protein
VELDRDTLGIVLTGVFAGLAMLLAVVALAKQPFLLLAALPFAAAAYLVWLATTGRIPFRGTRRVNPEEARRARTRGAEREPGSARSRFGREARATAGSRASRGQQRADPQSEPLARLEAARVLGVDADAEPATIRRAYRESVKEVHPDAEGGDREAFQRVNEAYERLQEE